ncbi:sulfatase [Urbifossiella limnaea]|uniref:Choline-sulfatase n=1 Tax=Urbifossiella limnaea TaxID=2528023 RepID=A0A517XZD3_9BACT|nr:sulfatase [Urbifossiella limnaea]QDU22843.1 Choline-sulfatase [Urbifossiella limnaea]
MTRLLALAALFLATGPAAAQDKMNVLFVVSDDLTNTALGCYQGRAKTPNIDKLAAKGVRFDRAYCQFPLCNPSRASLLTGLRPDTLRVYENATQFRRNVPDVQTLPQTFRRAGYYVARVGKLYHYGVPGQIGTDGLDDPPSWERVINPRGFDKDDEDANRIFTLNPKGKGSARFGGTLSWLASAGGDETHTDGMTATEITKLLEANKDRPFFLACGFFRPHTPYVAPRAYFDQYPAADITLASVPAGHRAAGPGPAFGSAKPEQEAMTDAQRREAIQAYLASVAFMDAQVGRVLSALDRLGLANRTIVVFLSDHGYHLGEHGLWQKMSLFENSARVPLVVHDPRAKGNGGVCRRTVELTDLHATLADACGLTAPRTDGASLRPLLENPAAAWERPAVTQVSRGTPTTTGEVTGKNPFFMGRSVRTERYRYTTWDDGKRGEQLFDYEADPGELRNLAADPASAETVRRMKALLPAAKK